MNLKERKRKYVDVNTFGKIVKFVPFLFYKFAGCFLLLSHYKQMLYKGKNYKRGLYTIKLVFFIL